jgi:hypothetical protein
MSGILNLNQLLKEMSPVLQDGRFVFCSFPGGRYGDHAHLIPIASIVESEGLTLVIPQEKADAFEIPYDGVYKAITLEVHSSLEAVGLTAAFATKLGEHNISANVIAGYFHDHIFVQAAKADQALLALGEFKNEDH